jgi:hypothetical protein
MPDVVCSAAMLLFRGDGFVDRVEERAMTPLEQVATQITELEAKITDLEYQVARSNRRYEKEKILAAMMIEHATGLKQEIDQLTRANKNE